GISKAAKKAGRVAAEGLVGVAVRGNAGALVEVNSETDFVARNDTFKAFARETASLALNAGGDLDRLLVAKMASGSSVQETLTNMIANIGENMSVRRAAVLEVEPGVVVSYVHNAAAPELGRIGVLVALRSGGDREKLASSGPTAAISPATSRRWPATNRRAEGTIMADAPRYGRVLLKISGEALMGSQNYGIEIGTVERIAADVKEACTDRVQLCLVIGGGNIFRGLAGAADGIERATADYMGMLATVMNALAVQAVLERIGVPTRVQSAIPMESVCEPYIRRRAIRHMEKGRVVIFAAGT